jgi:L-ascorbate metabolism protein UlaG (beta-lactamase superfamily)
MILIQWLGTAGFRVQAGGYTFLFDPHLSGASGPKRKRHMLGMDKLRADLIFVTHGHLDHAGDLPSILNSTDAVVLCNKTVATRLMASGIPRGRITLVKHGTRYFHKDYKAQVFRAPHAGTDILGLLRAFARVGPSIIREFSLFREYPAGLSVSFRLYLPGCRIQHFGSLGSPGRALHRMVTKGRPDILLLPLQRHIRWQSKAIAYIEILRPRVVIPHHHDDSLPPLTEALNIQPALETMASTFPKIRVQKLRVMETLGVRVPRGGRKQETLTKA